jgi:uncharacterized membrane protein YedE/YeeE
MMRNTKFNNAITFAVTAVLAAPSLITMGVIVGITMGLAKLSGTVVSPKEPK